MPGRADPCGPVDVDARVAVLGHDRLARMQAHPDPDVVVVGPVVLDEGSLGGYGGGGRIARALERGKELVTVGVDHGPVMVRHRFAKDPAFAARISAYAAPAAWRSVSTPRCRRGGS